MNYTEILLGNYTRDEKNQSANNIVNMYNLPLSTMQILQAHSKISNSFYWSYGINNLSFILSKILNTNPNMYIAIILALNDYLPPHYLTYFEIIIKSDKQEYSEKLDIGINPSLQGNTIYYCQLLDFYEFDVSDMPNITNEQKQEIEKYRKQKYSGKFTKCATKK